MGAAGRDHGEKRLVFVSWTGYVSACETVEKRKIHMRVP